MRTVWKTSIPLHAIRARNDIEVPHGAELLTVENQYGNLCLWYVCDPARSNEIIRLAIVGTGHNDVPDDARYVGTALFDDDGLVLHVFQPNETLL